MNPSMRTGRPIYTIYPEEDGSAISENTRQWRWIVTIAGGLQAVYAEQPDVFVAGNLLWYPVEGRPDIRTAPDALVAFGRPKGDRGSYLQWFEDGIAPQVVFEVLSPGNRKAELVRKFQFYERYGVEEYYLYDPEDNQLEGWRRSGDHLIEIDPIDGWISPRLKLRFVLGVEELEMYLPNEQRIPTFNEVIYGHARLEREAAEARRQTEQAQREAEQAQREAEQAQREAEQAQREVTRLLARLRALGIDPEEAA